MNSDEIITMLMQKGVISREDLEELETSPRNPNPHMTRIYSHKSAISRTLDDRH